MHIDAPLIPKLITDRRPVGRAWRWVVILGIIALIDIAAALAVTVKAHFGHLAMAIQSADKIIAAESTVSDDGIPVLDLHNPVLSLQIQMLLALVAPGEAPHAQIIIVNQELLKNSNNTNDISMLRVSQADFQGTLRLTFLVWLTLAGMVTLVILLIGRGILRHYYVAPLTALIDTINKFSEDPSVTSPIPGEVTGSPEFTAAAQALETLQRNTLLALRQRERLADIGEAVAKINHDIRNVLSSATLVADTLLASQDKRVRRLAPHIIRSLEQSVDLCQSMLDYLAETPEPEPVRFETKELFEEISESSGIMIRYSGPAELRLDRGMLSRILLNLARNAMSVRATQLNIDIWRAGRLGVIDISDDGPGIPRDQWDDLFLAFRSKNRGGSGLGLAIARDLAVAQGGNLKITRSTGDGSEFRLQLPMQMFISNATDTTSNLDKVTS